MSDYKLFSQDILEEYESYRKRKWHVKRPVAHWFYLAILLTGFLGFVLWIFDRG